MFDISRLIPGFQPQYKQIATTATPQLLIPADPTRPVLYVQNFTSSPALLTMDPIPPGGSIGQFQIAANDIIAFTWILDACLPTLGWYVWTPAGAGIVVYTEVRWLPQQLGAS